MSQAAQRQLVREVLAAVPPPRSRRARAPRRPRGQRASPPAAPPRGSGPRVKATYALPAELLDAFRASCAEQGVTQRGLVEALLRSYLRG